jgi:hypothetical protein
VVLSVKAKIKRRPHRRVGCGQMSLNLVSSNRRCRLIKSCVPACPRARVPACVGAWVLVVEQDERGGGDDAGSDSHRGTLTG